MIPAGRLCVGGSGAHRTGAQHGRYTPRNRDSLWVTGSCWAVAFVVYLLNGPSDLVWPLFLFGVLTGVAEWILRSMES